MQTFDRKPLSLTKRLGVSLNVDTGHSKTKIKDASPPRTPDPKFPRTGKANTTSARDDRALKIRTPPPRNTLLDDIAFPAANRQNVTHKPRNDRDPHDLSISPQQVTRASLVDTMLMSLDQFSSGHSGTMATTATTTTDEAQLYSAFGDGFQYSSYAASRTGRPSNHIHSYSTELEKTDQKSVNVLGVGRRSRSNSNNQIGGGRTDASLADLTGAQTTTASRPLQSQARVLHSRGGKGSKGSSANSLDLGYSQAAITRRWAHGVAGRSSSFDYGQDRSSRNADPATATFTPSDLDVAPTPTIPAGPRRQVPGSPVNAFPPEAPPIPHTIERQRSTRSSKSAYKGRPDAYNTVGTHYKKTSREIPPTAFKEQTAPAPLIGYGKPKENQNPNSTPQSKDKPGFFRRVFGSSRNNIPSVNTEQQPIRQGSATSMETVGDRSSSRLNHIGLQGKSQSVPVHREAPPMPKEQPHVLTKKPSSFFRRRKKSVTDTQQPTLAIANQAVSPVKSRLEADETLRKGAPSPTSSLRAVMNPYLTSPAKAPAESSALTRSEAMPLEVADTKKFSSGYALDKSATIRAVRPSSPDGAALLGADISSSGLGIDERRGTSTTSDETKDEQTLLVDSFDSEREPKTETTPTQTTLRTTTQAATESDTETITQTIMQMPTQMTSDNAASQLSPTIQSALAKDMALVAEYERVHSKRSPTATKTSGAGFPDISKANKATTTVLVKEGEWIVVSRPKAQEKDPRVWLEPSSSDENLPHNDVLSVDRTHVSEVPAIIEPLGSPALPLEGSKEQRTSVSMQTPYKIFPNVVIPSVDRDEDEEDFNYAEEIEEELRSSPYLMAAVDSGHALDPEPSSYDRERAQKIYDGNEDFIQKSKAAAWLGDEGMDRQRTILAYMELYDFANLNILAALRILCGRLVLKAETQQVDRILDAFSRRWCQCNPNHGFKVADVVHTICYSILLLNTDLHLADIESKMTKGQFVKNTVSTVLRVVADSAPDAFDSRPSILPSRSNTLEVDTQRSDSRLSNERAASRASNENERPTWRSSFLPPARSGSDGLTPTPLNYNTPSDDCGPLVKAPFHGTLRTWEVQVEIVLKDFYNSIRCDRLPLFGAEIEKSHVQNGLSVFTNGMLRRTPSVISKTPSDTQSFTRGRQAETGRLGTGKWSSKNRSRARVYPSSTMGSSRTSLDDQSSMWSPSVSSSTWSKYSLGKTQTSLSVDSFGSNWPQGDYQQSIGFANALSQAIIREENIGSAGSNHSEELRAAPLLEDESLELCGAPWAKEGIVKHKHHLESVDKRSKDRNWNETFAVIEKGYMSLFSFSSKSMRNKNKVRVPGGVVGGGNWQDNAEKRGSFLLRQTIASALPSPGYSKARPNVFALSLPTGAVHLFQVGTPEIVREFVSTANYWSARLSNHPLVGGISNIEYGWSDAIVSNTLANTTNESARPSTSNPRSSLQGSMRSSLEYSLGSRPKLLGDRILISDWTPPTQSMRSSNLMEQDQLRTLVTYVKGIEEELQKHNQLRSSMLIAFAPRQPNGIKALANWEKKSSYLLREIVKFRTYIDCLQAAELQKHKIYKERSLAAQGEDGDETLRP